MNLTEKRAWKISKGSSSPNFTSDELVSVPNLTGRPGCQTMEMNGGSSASRLACTPCVPLFCSLFNRGGNSRVLDYQGRAGTISLYGGAFARSHSVLMVCDFKKDIFAELLLGCPPALCAILLGP